jgi:hypothetical protein
MDVWSPQDLSSIWKCLNTGSGARMNGNKHFCHLFACCGNDIVRYLVEENRYGLIIHALINIITYIFSLIYFISFLDVIFVRKTIRSGVTIGQSGTNIQ